MTEHLSDRRFELFKFYENASQRTKSDAWTQTTWVLTISGAVLGFSMKLYVEHRDVPGFFVIAWLCAIAGVVLSAYVTYVLHQLAIYLRTYLTAANRLAAPDPFLKEYISAKDADAALHPKYEADYPQFIVRLLIPPLFFAVGHIAWVAYVMRCGA
jgi:hypothetical protein